jgi:hypothetical protein
MFLQMRKAKKQGKNLTGHGAAINLGLLLEEKGSGFI